MSEPLVDESAHFREEILKEEERSRGLVERLNGIPTLQGKPIDLLTPSDFVVVRGYVDIGSEVLDFRYNLGERLRSLNHPHFRVLFFEGIYTVTRFRNDSFDIQGGIPKEFSHLFETPLVTHGSVRVEIDPRERWVAAERGGYWAARAILDRTLPMCTIAIYGSIVEPKDNAKGDS